jgi:thioredoxin reductase (NADPH)
MPDARHTRVLIIGSGPAGYTAGVYASRAMLAPILVQGIEPGGQLTTTTDVENWPGDETVMGPDLMVRMETHARAMGCEIVGDIITSLDLSTRPFVAKGDSGATYTADAVILCDGFFDRGAEIAVVGGGNTAVEEALFLTNFASKVTVIHRRNTFRAERIMQDRLFAHPKITVLWDHELAEVVGDHHPKGVTGIRARNVKTGAITDIPAKGVFIAIGHAPASELVAGQLETHHGGYVKVEPGTTNTAIPGVFAAGDLTDMIYRQAVTSAGMGCMAALDAERFLAEHGKSS